METVGVVSQNIDAASPSHTTEARAQVILTNLALESQIARCCRGTEGQEEEEREKRERKPARANLKNGELYVNDFYYHC